jgi:radical SAM superfamily enzyme YgiQ (UPF0313 family)
VSVRAPRVLLLHPGSLYGGPWAGSVRLKGALVGLYSYLRAHGVPVDVLDLQAEFGNPEPELVDAFLQHGAERILSYDFDVLGISCWSSLEYLAAVEFATRTREARPAAQIVVGGYHPSAVPADFTYAGTPFDVVVTGEGEIALLELLRDGPAGGGSGPARVVAGSPLPLDRPYFDLDGYPYLKDRPATVTIYLSRGCPYRCAFCMEGSKKHKGWRYTSVDDALTLVRRARSYNPSVIVFGDACFGYQDHWRRDFLEGLIDMGIDRPLWAEMRADRITEGDIDLCRKLDLYLQFGVETMSSRMAEITRKAADGEKYVRAVDATLREVARSGVLANVFLVLNHPGETPATAEETVSYFERFVAGHDHLTVIVNAGRYQYFVGSDTAVRHAWYEKTYGARFGHPDWYRERGPQFDLAQANRASDELSDIEPYVERLKALHPEIIRKMPATQQLRFLSHLRQLG